MSGEVVVGYDGTLCARYAVREAARLAGRLEVDVLVVFCALPPALYGGGAGDQRRLIAERGAELVAEGATLAGSFGATARTLVEPEEPAPGLLAAARATDAEMIVVGTRSEALWKSALIGSTPHKLLHLSDWPVLVVPVDPDEPLPDVASAASTEQLVARSDP